MNSLMNSSANLTHLIQFPQMAESSSSTEIKLLLRSAIKDWKDQFRNHEVTDEARHISNTARLTALEVGQAGLKGYIRGRTVAITAFLTLAIPILSWFVNVLFGPHAPVKP